MAGAGYFARFHLEAWQRLQSEGRVVLAAVAEPAILKGRRYGNLVLAAVRELPKDRPAARHDPAGNDPVHHDGGRHSAPQGAAEARGGREDDVVRPDLREARLGRALRTLAVPATLLVGDDATAFAGTAAPLETAAP